MRKSLPPNEQLSKFADITFPDKQEIFDLITPQKPEQSKVSRFFLLPCSATESNTILHNKENTTPGYDDDTSPSILRGFSSTSSIIYVSAPPFPGMTAPGKPDRPIITVF